MATGVCSQGDVQKLYEAAKQVLDGKPARLLKGPVEALEALAKFRDSEDGQVVMATARDLYVDNDECDVEIDDATILYYNGESGYWVQGWLFVSDEITGVNAVATDETRSYGPQARETKYERDPDGGIGNRR